MTSASVSSCVPSSVKLVGADHLRAADEEHLDARPRRRRAPGRRRPRRRAWCWPTAWRSVTRSMALHLVADAGGALELACASAAACHLALERAHDLVRAAFEEEDDLADDLVVLLLRAVRRCRARCSG